MISTTVPEEPESEEGKEEAPEEPEQEEGKEEAPEESEQEEYAEKTPEETGEAEGQTRESENTEEDLEDTGEIVPEQARSENGTIQERNKELSPEVCAAYLELLTQQRGQMSSTARNIVFSDICGDDTPEMIYIQAVPVNGETADTASAALHIVTYENDRLRELYAGEIDRANYYLFQISAEKTLYEYSNQGSDIGTEQYSRYTASDPETLVKEPVCSRSYNSQDASVLFQVNGMDTDEGQFRASVEDMQAGTSAVLMYGPGCGEFAEAYVSQHGCQAVSLDDAVVFLSAIIENTAEKEPGEEAQAQQENAAGTENGQQEAQVQQDNAAGTENGQQEEEQMQRENAAGTENGQQEMQVQQENAAGTENGQQEEDQMQQENAAGTENGQQEEEQVQQENVAGTENGQPIIEEIPQTEDMFSAWDAPPANPDFPIEIEEYSVFPNPGESEVQNNQQLEAGDPWAVPGTPSGTNEGMTGDPWAVPGTPSGTNEGMTGDPWAVPGTQTGSNPEEYIDPYSGTTQDPFGGTAPTMQEDFYVLPTGDPYGPDTPVIPDDPYTMVPDAQGWTDSTGSLPYDMPVMDPEQQKMDSLRSFLLKANYYGEYNYLDSQKSTETGRTLLEAIMDQVPCVDESLYPGEGIYRNTAAGDSSFDPYGRWQSWARFSVSKQDWILRNIFHCPEDAIAQMKSKLQMNQDMNPNGFYMLDSYYYRQDTQESHSPSVTMDSPIFDGMYYTVYYTWNDSGMMAPGTRAAVLEYRNIEGKDYWTLYYMGSPKNPGLTGMELVQAEYSQTMTSNPMVTDPNMVNPNMADPNMTDPNMVNPNMTDPNMTDPSELYPTIAILPPEDPYAVPEQGNTDQDYVTQQYDIVQELADQGIIPQDYLEQFGIQ